MALNCDDSISKVPTVSMMVQLISKSGEWTSLLQTLFARFLIFYIVFVFLVFRLVGASCMESSTFAECILGFVRVVLAFRMIVCHQTARKQQSRAKCSICKPGCIVAWVLPLIT